MASTLKRDICPDCQKKNLSTWEYNKKTFQQCKTHGCSSASPKLLKDDNDTECTYTQQHYTSPRTFAPITSCEFKAISARGLSKEICVRYNYQVGDWRGLEAHIESYYNRKTLDFNAQKVRIVNKKEFFKCHQVIKDLLL